MMVKMLGFLIFLIGTKNKKKLSWGFYIGDDSSLGIGGMVPPYFYNFAFNYLEVDVVRAVLFFDNVKTIKLHLLQGYQFEPNLDHVIPKNGKSILMVAMKLENETFKTSRFKRSKREFPINKWHGNPLKGIVYVQIELENIIPTDSQILILFEQLKQREHSISHENLPSYETHKQFVTDNPYRAWFLVKKDREILGNIYVQHDNSVGLNNLNNVETETMKEIIKALRNQLKPLSPIDSVRYKDFYFNVSASNVKLQEKLKNMGCKVAQISFIYR